MSLFASALLAAPWILTPIVTVLRARHSRSLDEEPDDAPPEPPAVSIVIPARNEAHNIRRCLESACTSAYPRLEIIVVDDHSDDGTGDVARSIAAGDDRVRVITSTPLPPGWFGKQWACATGAAAARGSIIGFLDADTWQRSDLITRTVRAILSRDADLLSVAGTQELGSFWERVFQPQMFTLLLARFGGTESMNRSKRASQKIANGQCLFVRRAAYEALEGHALVKGKVAEDLALAQQFFASGKRVALVLGLDQLRTRMYRSLSEVVEGWGKNIYAGGLDAVPLGAIGRPIYPLMLLTPPMAALLPPAVLVLSSLGVLGSTAFWWSVIATGASVLWWLLVYRWLRLSLAYALAYPLGAGLLLYIAVRAIVRGRRVRWKGREYQAA